MEIEPRSISGGDCELRDELNIIQGHTAAGLPTSNQQESRGAAASDLGWSEGGGHLFYD